VVGRKLIGSRSAPVPDRLAGEVAGRMPSRIERPQLQGSSGNSSSGSCRPVEGRGSAGATVANERISSG
jgi:hypothetical protein